MVTKQMNNWGVDLIPPQDISAPDFFLPATRFRGNGNPENVTAPFHLEALRKGLYPHNIRKKCPGYPRPLWTNRRFGQTATRLADGRVVEIGGEHEDWYDEDFLIFNDVIVHDGIGGAQVLFYSPMVFPPTDFHTATLANDSIWIIGRLGYSPDRHIGRTPVFLLSLDDFSIRRVQTNGLCPGWIYKHETTFLDGNVIVTGGLVVTEQGEEANESAFELDLSSFNWRKI